jgi:hypothetical protein
MPLATERYEEQVKLWPASGRHILAWYDEEAVVVYQAYKPSIGRYAAKHGRLGGDEFSWTRMSWIKPNFLWMMYRSGWGTKPNQEATLALRVRRAFFDSLLASAVISSWDRENGGTFDEWERAVATSNVRLQWDPDHGPDGARVERRALQLGLRGDALEAFGTSELLGVEDISDFVAEQRERLAAGGVAALLTPRERVYVPADPATRERIRLSE